MVIVRPGRIEQQLKQQQQQQQILRDRMFKVPTSSAPSPPQAQVDMLGKRRWQEAFQGEATPSAPPPPPHRLPQLTIFYAGAVNVYDNVPENMVKALMTLAAAKSSKPAGLSDLQRSCSSNVPGFTNSQVQNKAAASNSGSFAFPSLQTTSCNLSLNSSFRAAGEDRSAAAAAAAAVAPQQQSAAAPAPEQSASGSAATPTPPASPGVDFRSMASRTRMQMLPAGLPQARRASIQRFLQKRKQKQVNESNNEDEADAAAADTSTLEMKPTSGTSQPSTGPHGAPQVPRFLMRSTS